MKFQDFCNQQQDADGQVVAINNTFVISFGKPGGTSFNIDPEVVALFLQYLIDHHDVCRSKIESDARYTASNFTNYQEKPYRALYRMVEGEPTLNTIKSLGGSQTNQLTRIISKMICFLAGIAYTKIEENTHFDKQAVTAALNNMPNDLKTLAAESPSENDFGDTSNMRKFFEVWLKEKKSLSDKSIKNYAGSAMSKVDAIIYGPEDKQTIYDIRYPDALEVIIEELGHSPEWQQKNTDGKEMWSTAVNHYHNFLKELEFSNPRLPPIDAKVAIPLAKPFLLLAGISGTGKTRFVREQARAFDSELDNFCLVPVRPDWHEPSELLGYVTRLTGMPQYVPTELMTFIVRAWEVVAPYASATGCGAIDIDAVPYWLCLDEMNLAPVEQYFADYLSVLESRIYEFDKYSCDPLVSKELIKQLEAGGASLRESLGVSSDGLWDYFRFHGIQLPPNLIVAGTVNMDETTHGFSRKVIDRAITLDFGEFYPNEYKDFFDPSAIPAAFSWSTLTHASTDRLENTWDFDGKKSIGFLEGVNTILKQTPFELAYRALNELLLQVTCIEPSSDIELQAVWDDFLMMKILPRIEGDDDKLRSTSGQSQGNVLEELDGFLSAELGLIWSRGRTDFFRINLSGEDDLRIECRSKTKIEWMRNRLEVNTFTSFWP